MSAFIVAILALGEPLAVVHACLTGAPPVALNCGANGRLFMQAAV